MDTDQIIIEKFISTHTSEAVRLIEKMDYNKIAVLLKEIPAQLAIKVLCQMNSYRAAKALEQVELGYAIKLCEKMDLVILESLIRQFDDRLKEKFLNNLSPEKAGKLRQKLMYSADTVGALMNPKVYFLLEDKSIKEAETIIKKSKELTTSEIYITNQQRQLTGILKLHDLLLAKGSERISTIMITKVPKFLADEPIEPVINNLVWTEYKAVPVVDKSGLLIGSLQFNDLKKFSINRNLEHQQLMETGNALGELYRIGLTALLQSTGKFD